MDKIQGIYAASLTIFSDDLSINEDKTIRHADFLIDNGCHGVVILGSTGQSQLISISEKIKLINSLPKSKNFERFIIGTGSNSLGDTINLIKISMSLKLKYFLIMPPAYYSYTDKNVIEYFSKIIESVKDCRIILYNYEKLSGYKFSINCIDALKNKFPTQIVGIKDSTYNLYNKYQKKDLSIFVGSEEKLLTSLEIGCQGVISATCNVTSKIARKIFDDFHDNKIQLINDKLCNIRKAFNKFNLISGLHSYMSQKDRDFKNVLPIIDLLSKKDEKKLFEELRNLEFNIDY
ncbi:MAG: dihydrodipicolinate synthase family protein [Candidatus Pelagibacter sp. TMED118]|nr:MAG: dihydrodipicolinate synthase family protein [Candidatus Pelagibacter sp. TMED118]|tara:strand:- start:1090 stop:1962 length:873 start_codon:yes stop_codon:yes gene_type:complete